MKLIGDGCGLFGGRQMSELEKLLIQSSTLAKAHRGAKRRDRERQKRLEPVLKMMAEDDQRRKYYWLTDDKAHADFIILVFAIRDVGTGELSIPREKYDPFLLMEILDKHQAGGIDS